ncbi:MAG: DUF3822 family protein [Bacteroidaceae bacterium]|nr:DUF3822 family protein [Bacteroidaceae bacterium]
MQVTGNNNISNKSLSIRISTNGLSFCIYAPSEEPHYVYSKYKVRPTISMAANLKDALLNEPLLKEEYQRVNVMVTSPHFTVVPTTAFKSEDINDIYAFNFPKDETKHVSFNILRRQGLAIIFGLDKNVHQLITDDFPRARFYASASTLAEFFAERSAGGKMLKMYAYIHEREMTLFVFEHGRLLFVNTFESAHAIDYQYFILNVWKQLEMDQLTDMLHVVGDNDMAQQLTTSIASYIKSVELINREDDFSSKLTQGNSVIPYDLQTLLVCGF